jgi:hypothetical protein
VRLLKLRNAHTDSEFAISVDEIQRLELVQTSTGEPITAIRMVGSRRQKHYFKGSIDDLVKKMLVADPSMEVEVRKRGEPIAEVFSAREFLRGKPAGHKRLIVIDVAGQQNTFDADDFHLVRQQQQLESGYEGEVNVVVLKSGRKIFTTETPDQIVTKLAQATAIELASPRDIYGAPAATEWSHMKRGYRKAK